MSISRSNWEISKDSYADFVKGLKRRANKDKKAAHDIFDTNECGYCTEDDKHEYHGNDACVKCLFGGGGCAKDYGGYGQMQQHVSERKYKQALTIAERILQAIIDDEPNVYEDKPVNEPN